MSHTYRAFISYSQKDRDWGKRIHRWLETYRVPLGSAVDLRLPDRLGKFFRDDEDMAAAADIGGTVREALQGSESLIVICSPRSAQSAWVNAEIEHFRKTGRASKVFAVIIDGKPNSGNPDTECFPPALRAVKDPGTPGAMPVEPVGLDVRSDGRARLCARLAAGLLDVGFDDLWQRDLRRRRANRVRAGAVATGVLAAGALLFGFQEPLKQMYRKSLVYGPFVHAAAALDRLPAGASFEDCRPQSGDCPEMVIVPAGDLVRWAGSDEPETEVLVTVPRIAVSRHEITHEDWAVCAARGGCRETPLPDDFGMGRGTRPVTGISWHDAKAYADWLSAMTGKSYRLLTESEWEHAARGGTTTTYAWGDAFFPDEVTRAHCYICTWGGNTPQQTLPVGTYPPNDFGLHDMAGNVWEWVEDCYLYPEDMVIAADASAPPEETCRRTLGSPGHGPGSGLEREVPRLLAGGSWRSGQQEVTPDSRIHQDPKAARNDAGFRVARDVGAAHSPARGDDGP